jgi:hypothetical protein
MSGCGTSRQESAKRCKADVDHAALTYLDLFVHALATTAAGLAGPRGVPMIGCAPRVTARLAAERLPISSLRCFALCRDRLL